MTEKREGRTFTPEFKSHIVGLMKTEMHVQILYVNITLQPLHLIKELKKAKLLALSKKKIIGHQKK